MRLKRFGNFLVIGRFLAMIVRELDCTNLLAMNPFERSFVATMYRGETTDVGIRQSIYWSLIECAGDRDPRHRGQAQGTPQLEAEQWQRTHGLLQGKDAARPGSYPGSRRGADWPSSMSR